MISLKLFLISYLIGGITFFPLVLYTLWCLKRRIDQIDDQYQEDLDNGGSSVRGIDPNFKAGEFEEAKGVQVFKQGWLSVTKKYYYHHTELSSEEITSNDDDIPQRSQLKKKHRFYAILRHGNLFLYRDNLPKSNLVHAISLQDTFVTIWPRNPDSELPDSALFTKRTCISILRKGVTSLKNDKLEFKDKDFSNADSQTTKQFFLYVDNNIEKEDWYFSLINVSKNEINKDSKPTSLIDPNVTANTAHLKTKDSLYLIQTINSTESQLTTKWINALIGRLFLALQGTDMLKEYLYTKLYQKLTKIDKPDFLDDFAVEEVDVGVSAPIITNPKLLDLSPEGVTKISIDFQYKGDLSVIVSTKATINLGSHFRQREVPMQLSIKLKELSGPLIVLLKPPPSNRIWYTFQSEPVLSLEIEPVVSSSKLSYNMITNAIKSKFVDALKESLVVPYWDDLVFYNTESEIYRGGIWEKYDKESVLSSSNDKQPPITDKPDSNLDQDGALPAETDTDSDKDSDTINNLASSTSEDSQNTARTPESTIKRRTLQKVENLKKVLKTKSREEFQDDESSNEAPMEATSSAIGDSEDSEDSVSSNKLFKNSIKKFGKWYKEAVNNPQASESAASSEAPKNLGSSAHTPEMISNRRKSVPRRLPPSNASSSSGARPESLPTSPTLNATEMFAYKDRNKSRSSTISADMNFNPVLQPNYKQLQTQAFVKVRDSDDFAQELVREEITEQKFSTARNRH